MESKLSDVKKFLIGTLLGIISAVPGVSGVILAVTFGVYERLVEDIADIRHKIREDFRFLLVLGLGLLFGIVIISFGLTFVIDNYKIAAMLLFFGMIVGQLPELRKYTMPEIKPSKRDIAARVIGVAIMCSLLVFGISSIEYSETTHEIKWVLLMLLIGVIYAISHIAPGISGSTLLFAFGLLYLPLETIREHDFVLLLPLVIGTFIGLIGFAKIVHYAIVRYRKTTYMMIFGFAVGSVLIVLRETYNAYNEPTDLILGVAALAVGILLSLWFSRIGKRTSAEYTVR
jgi:putative membrane protein